MIDIKLMLFVNSIWLCFVIGMAFRSGYDVWIIMALIISWQVEMNLIKQVINNE